MIKVTIKSSHQKVYEVIIKGHANYADYGQDIVCAAVSTLATTTINAIIALEDTIDYELKDSGLLDIRVLKDTDVNKKLLDNFVRMLDEIKAQYPKNIEIRNED